MMRVRTLIVALLLLGSTTVGCTSRDPNASAAESRYKPMDPPWAGMSPDKRDRTAMADLVRSEKFSRPSCRWLKNGAWILAWPSETHLYKAAHQLGYIEMEEAGTDNRIGTPEPAWRITITDGGKTNIAECKVSSGRNDWGVPVSRRKLISARYVGEAHPISGITLYEIDYEWVPTAVGDLVKAHLTDKMAVEEGKYRTRISLRKVSDGWYVEQIDDLGAQRIP